jgi:4-methyl-5(b-hydroxyethyl)-thiazole monophosphate biosynthesis
MNEAIVFLTDGFEEIEALTVVDILRRGGVDVITVSLTGNRTVTGSHDIPVIADTIFPNFNADINTMLILPGGPGTADYKKNEQLLNCLRNHYSAGGRLAAICAAPTLLGMLDILKGKKACCYPGFEQELSGAEICDVPVVVDGNIITGRSAGASMEFALAVLAVMKGDETAETVREKLVI